eukprot:comp170336_c0_seq1/m.49544 comp170336_c0_seq1/g.49544  ORF comp170336_c0_seq1/g.49544 comp170336_c0_seq1/m.49544 type:complete len:162 (-) comp170336_c0_seq1:59-544(-)
MLSALSSPFWAEAEFTISEDVHAPKEKVYAFWADPLNIKVAHPFVQNVEVLKKDESSVQFRVTDHIPMIFGLTSMTTVVEGTFVFDPSCNELNSTAKTTGVSIVSKYTFAYVDQEERTARVTEHFKATCPWPLRWKVYADARRSHLEVMQKFKQALEAPAN